MTSLSMANDGKALSDLIQNRGCLEDANQEIKCKLMEFPGVMPNSSPHGARSGGSIPPHRPDYRLPWHLDLKLR